MNMDTIVAAATPLGRGGVSVVRLSGPAVREMAQAILGYLPEPRMAHFSSFFDTHHNVMDHGIALFFPSPHSFTGEDVLELQGHGAPVVVHFLIQRAVELGARLARPGEFSERAFLNGKMDLTQAEAVADLIHAGTEQAARSAMRSLQGEFSKKIRELVELITQLRIYVEAAIDFVEDEIDFLSNDRLKKKFIQVLQTIEIIKDGARQGALLRDGVTVVIAGKPNVGKSTLLNGLSGKELAIVTDIPGTTRDIVREHISMDGIPLHIIDTAGLRETSDLIEQEGIRRAKKEIENADLVLYMIDNEATVFDVVEMKANVKVPVIIVRNKIDLRGELPSRYENTGIVTVALSAKEHHGLDLLKESIKSHIGFASQNEGVCSARQRHIEALTRAQIALETAFKQLLENRAGELVAEDLRQSQKALGEITGELTTEDLLGRIFSQFCIGK